MFLTKILKQFLHFFFLYIYCPTDLTYKNIEKKNKLRLLLDKSKIYVEFICKVTFIAPKR